MVSDRRFILLTAALAVATVTLVTGGLTYDRDRARDVTSADTSSRDNPITRIQPDAYYDDPWVYFIGDDYTDGKDFRSGQQSTWINLVGSARDWYPRNIGISGAGYATSASNGNSFIDQIEKSNLSDADAIVISGGLNDAISETPIEIIGSRISQAMTRIRAVAPKTPLTIVSVFNPQVYVPERINAINSKLEAEARRVGAVYVYASNLLKGDPSLVAPDNFHATAEGHAHIAQALAPQIAPPNPGTRK